MYPVYSALFLLALLLLLPYWLVQMLRSGKYRQGLAERLGRVPERLLAGGGRPCIWVHAVSVGEVLAVSRLVAGLREKFPDWRVVVSTTTLTGQRLARERFGESEVFYLPLDMAFAVRNLLAVLRPRMLVLAETEFWPNLLHEARQSGARVAVVNARISDRSLPRYRAVRGLLRRVLNNVDIFLAQSKQDRERLIEVGADPMRVQMGGNLKYDVNVAGENALMDKMRLAIAGAPVIVCGSTVEGEEELVVAAFRAVLARVPEAVMILAPRHPERFENVWRSLANGAVRRSTWNGEALPGEILLLDSIGELAALYSLATLAFVGGSLVPRGGHNILEPAQFGKPIVVGPHTANFRAMMAEFREAGAVMESDAEKLAEDWIELLEHPERARQCGEAARKVFESQAGATQRTLNALETLLWMPESIKARYQQKDVPR